jgi:cytochrome P450
MTDLTQEMVEEWQPGAEVNISQEMQHLTLRIIARSLFNIESRERADELGRAFDTVINASRRRFGKVRLQLPFTSYGRALIGKRTLDKFVYEIINERRKDRRDQGDVLSMLLEAEDEGTDMSNKQVHDHVLTFVAAGHETAQNTMSWTFYLLSQHPEVRDKLLNELRTVLNGRVPTVDDLAHLPYLDQVINESWRFYPPAWIQSRRSIEPVELDGYRFPTGSVFMLSQWVMHHLSDVWGDPENFRPERWDPVSGQKPPQGAYFPFGGGPRICIGMPFAQMETRLLLATILQRYTPELVPGFPVVIQPRVTLRPKYGIHMTLRPTPNIPAELPAAG